LAVVEPCGVFRPTGVNCPTGWTCRPRSRGTRHGWRRSGRRRRKIEAPAQQRLAAEEQVYEAKVAAREARQNKSGKKFGRKPPKPPTGGVRELDQINLTGDESRIMRAADGGFEQAYNAQALIEVDSKLILGALVTQHPIDVQQIEPALAI